MKVDSGIVPTLLSVCGQPQQEGQWSVRGGEGKSDGYLP